MQILTRKCVKGFAVEAMFRLPMEEMFETATHVARFETEFQAKRFAEKVRAKIKGERYPLKVLDLRYWQGPTSKAAAVQWNAEVEPFFVPFVEPPHGLTD